MTGSRRSSFTGRAAVLALVVCALVLALAYPLRQYVAQRQRIAELEDQLAARQQRVEALRLQEQRWRDPAFVKAQARQRLQFVLPGETAFVVLDEQEQAAKAAAEEVAAPKPPPPPSAPWYDRLWGSVEQADAVRG